MASNMELWSEYDLGYTGYTLTILRMERELDAHDLKGQTLHPKHFR